VRQCLENFGQLDILVNNAAFQRTYTDIGDISTEEWDRTFRTNIYAPFFSPMQRLRGQSRTSPQGSPKWSPTRESV
jgi:NAD(P)-dependent dehydrogenase (short-subunit alcohol dehydrogenase family)